jgi:alkaline phosphatase D
MRILRSNGLRRIGLAIDAFPLSSVALRTRIKLAGFALCGTLYLVGLTLSSSGFQAASKDEKAVSRIAFGSCADQQKPCPIWGTIADYQPDRLLLLGDNIYADLVGGQLKPATPERIAAAYEELEKLPDFQRLRNQTKILATWDDHDYGNNDAGVEWEHKDVAAKLFHDFLRTPADSELRKQRGVYSSEIVGPPGKRVQFIMLDTRYFRSELEKGGQPLPGFRARPYIPASAESATMLGETQWKWLEQELLKPAEVRLIASSIQVLSNDHPFEKWGNFPRELQRLFDLLRKTEASGVILLSGDRHLGEISLDPEAISYPLYDITASGLNQANSGWRSPEPNRFQVASLAYGNHFGAVEIDWSLKDPLIKLQLRHEDGEIAVQARVLLSQLNALPADKPLLEGFVTPAQAFQIEVGEAAYVQFTVRSARAIAGGTRVLINSEKDNRNPKNLTVVLERSALTGPLADLDPSTLINKTIKASGVISLYNGTKQVQISDSSGLEVLN